MASVNKVILIGNLGKDPEIKYTPGGSAVASFPVATTDRWTDKGGQKQERTEWHNIVVWARQAELANQYLRKGSPVYLEGRLQTRSWDDRDGNKKYRTEIVCTQMQFLSGGPSRDRSQSAGPSMGSSYGGQRDSGFDDSYGGGGNDRGPSAPMPPEMPPEDDLPF